ncbi:MAG: thiamine ABC transporter substrate-binding protein [Ilumatobacteraceae bacterium]|jgi:thiamine transport system substrate-binding protein
MNRLAHITAAAVTALLVAVLPACSSDVPDELTLIVYDSFPTAGTPLNEALAEFSADTGIAVRIAVGGDAGTMVTKAVLTAGNPEGDVMWGVDNTLLSAALNGAIFDGEPIAVDTGDVCVNYDIAWFAERGIEPPQTFDDLIEPAYADLLVVQNPATSSPGLAFLLATIAATDDWRQYWTALADNGVEVVDSWTTAYYDRFTGAAGGAGGGDRPLVVSYATSPPAEVVFADPPRDDAPTAVSTGTCFRQVEYAGVLRGTDSPEAARLLVEFLVSERFQRELPLTLFVNPVNPDVELPEVFRRFAAAPDTTWSVESDDIAANREQWQDEWADIVLR